MTDERSDFQKDFDELLTKHYPDNVGYLVAVGLGEGVMVFGKTASEFDTMRMQGAIEGTCETRLQNKIEDLLKRSSN
jgi:hypothetical protein